VEHRIAAAHAITDFSAIEKYFLAEVKPAD
jgi:hypothetical protein